MKNRKLFVSIAMFIIMSSIFSAGCAKDKAGQLQQVENLKRQLQSKDSVEKIKAIFEIEKIKNKQILIQLIPALINALDDTTAVSIPVKFKENPRGKEVVWVTYRVSTSANEAVVVLKRITGQNFGEEKSKWQEWWKNEEKFGGKI